MAQVRPMSLEKCVKLNNGLSMPAVKLGMYMQTSIEANYSVKWALQAGYRGIDSAQWYYNEKDVGEAIKTFLRSPENTSGLTRKDIWFTTKLQTNSTYSDARRDITRSVKECGLDYVDLFLLHSPYGGKKARLEAWRAVEDAIFAGEVRTGGVSNYGIKHLKELFESKLRIMPAINQIEVHPFNTREELCDYCTKHAMVVEAYAPLVRAMRMEHSTIVALAEKYDCTPAQLLVRWSLQHGYCPLPKSIKRERILENSSVDGFIISDEDMQVMNSLDEQLVTDWDPLDAP